MRDHLDWPVHWQERRFFLFFICLLIYLVLYPFVEHDGSEYAIFRILAATVTLVSVYAISFRRGFAFFALGLAIPVLIQRLALTSTEANALSLVLTSITFAFDLVVIVVVFRRVFAMDQPNSEAVFGALCIYLLVGFSFANGYLLLSKLQPHAFLFDPAANFPRIPDRFTFVYYSFGTMTSLGAQGITPASDEARSLSIIQAMLGLFYLAVLISRLMTLYTGSSVSKRNNEP